ncbi:hypothetical protein BC830DRAFT_1095946 [Chytriomyces sp. MP71]|nr:hypothetical protein BC830DRAFT_1095946 [Chytriomyces sp. MP71]
MPSMKMPSEVYPIVGMISVALGFGTYVAHKALTTDQDLRIGKRGYNPENWQRVGTEVDSHKTRFPNYFYQHITEEEV